MSAGQLQARLKSLQMPGQIDTVQLTARQQEILRRVVEEFVATGQPVGSKTLVERSTLNASPSTVRAELAELESLGLLTHPHTSAGRVPTERGYRYYADELLDRLDPQPAAFPLDLHTTRHRGRVGAPGDDGDAVAGHAAARARLRAAARGDARPCTSRCCCSSPSS